MGEGLPAVQAGAVAARRPPLRERVRLQVHGVQRRPPPLLGQGLRLLPDEVRRRLHPAPLQGGGGSEPSGGAQIGPHYVHEVRIEGEFGEA